MKQQVKQEFKLKKNEDIKAYQRAIDAAKGEVKRWEDDKTPKGERIVLEARKLIETFNSEIRDLERQLSYIDSL